MDAARSSNGFGGNPLSFGEIEAWSRLHEQALAIWEVRAIRAMDKVRLEIEALRQEELRGDPPLSVSAMDAMFEQD